MNSLKAMPVNADSTQDYYPYGMLMPGKIYSNGSYRFGFNIQEKLDEISGSGNHNTALFWEYDTRLGRRWNVDPIFKAWESSYACLHNNPIWLNDPYGDDPPEDVGGPSRLSTFFGKLSTGIGNLFRSRDLVYPEKRDYEVDLLRETKILNTYEDYPREIKDDIPGRVYTVPFQSISGDPVNFSNDKTIRNTRFNFNTDGVRQIQVFRKNFFGKEKEIFSTSTSGAAAPATPYFKSNRILIPNRNDYFRIAVTYRKPNPAPAAAAEFDLPDAHLMVTVIVTPSQVASYSTTQIIRVTGKHLESMEKAGIIDQ